MRIKAGNKALEMGNGRKIAFPNRGGTSNPGNASINTTREVNTTFKANNMRAMSYDKYDRSVLR